MTTMNELLFLRDGKEKAFSLQRKASSSAQRDTAIVSY
jgi:hypothetical protein